jgi:exosome complex component RRP42
MASSSGRDSAQGPPIRRGCTQLKHFFGRSKHGLTCSVHSIALVNLSPAELSFLRSALAQTPPIRLDVTKGPRDFRSMRAEYDVLPGANGSARIALEDGTEALVGVKAEVERTRQRPSLGAHEDVEMRDDGDVDESKGKGQNSWLEMSVEVPGFREDDALPVFLASMLKESLLASGELKDRLYINRRFHWKLYVDVEPPLQSPTKLH